MKDGLDYQPRQTEIKFLKGIGEYRSTLLKNIGIYTVNDLWEFFPRNYIHREVNIKIRNLEVGQYISMQVTVFEIRETQTKLGSKQLKVLVTDGDRFIECLWFHYGKWITNKLVKGKIIWLTGQVTEYLGSLQIVQPQIEESKPHEETNDFWQSKKTLPIYRLTGNLTQNNFRTMIYTAFSLYHHAIDETLPEFIQKKYNFLERKIALQKMHFTQDPQNIGEVKNRFIYEEFFYMQLLIARTSFINSQINKVKIHINRRELTTKLKGNLTFQLTGSQKSVIKEIFADMTSVLPMNRLLQGDVGAGKTIVTVFAICLALENGFQAAMVAPTEILAEQHYQTITKLFIDIGGINICLIKGGKNKQKNINKDKIKSGEINLVIGTHALFQRDIIFKNLSLVIIDEQHRFGVQQRSELSMRHQFPDLLYLSATPIPRSLAMTVFGEMTISSIDELPPARKSVKTILVPHGQKESVYHNLEEELQKGSQVYIVCPIIEESEKIDLQDAESLYLELRERLFPQYATAILHGKMKTKDKDQIMKDFSLGITKILVSTTVIEVGIDVPNASVMIIEHAERFGLSQLHQLRGRVGRGVAQSYCYLIAYGMNDIGKQRLHTMVKTDNGFEIAEKDLELRGPGDLFGTIQSGLPEFKFANLINDQVWLNAAKQDAFAIIAKDPELRQENHLLVKEYYFKNIECKENLKKF